MRPIVATPFAATIALLGGTLLIANVAVRRFPEPLVRPLAEISPSIQGWKAVEDYTLDARVLKSLAPTSYLVREYRKEEDYARLFIAFYAQQRGGESMHSPKHCLPGAGWEIWRHDSSEVPFNGKSVTINKYSIQSDGARMLMFYWYQSANRIVANEYVGKFLLARDTLVTGRTAGSIVRILVPDKTGAEDQGIALSAAIMQEVQRCFGD